MRPCRFPENGRRRSPRGGVIDRRRYETATVATVRERLQSGDLWVEGTREHLRFDSYMLPPGKAAEIALTLPFDTDGPAATWRGAPGCSTGRLRRFAGSLKRGTLDGVELRGGNLRVSPLAAVTPRCGRQAGPRPVDRLMPRVRITEAARRGGSPHRVPVRISGTALGPRPLQPAGRARRDPGRRDEPRHRAHGQRQPGASPTPSSPGRMAGTYRKRITRQGCAIWWTRKPRCRSRACGATAPRRARTGSSSARAGAGRGRQHQRALRPGAGAEDLRPCRRYLRALPCPADLGDRGGGALCAGRAGRARLRHRTRDPPMPIRAARPTTCSRSRTYSASGSCPACAI